MTIGTLRLADLLEDSGQLVTGDEPGHESASLG